MDGILLEKSSIGIKITIGIETAAALCRMRTHLANQA